MVTLNPVEIFVLMYLQLGGVQELAELEHEMTAGEGYRVEAVRGAVAYLRRNRMIYPQGFLLAITELGARQLRRELERASTNEHARYKQAFANHLEAAA